VHSAIKVTKDAGDTEDLEQEIRILRSLRHPNIVLFMGVALNDKTRYIVTELMLGNSLDALIHQHKPASRRNQLHVAIQFSKKVELLRDVIKGMIYLHGLTPSIVHRDLKPSVS
jgi:serine/threonine protein kinase